MGRVTNNDNPSHPSYLTGLTEEEYDNMMDDESTVDFDED